MEIDVIDSLLSEPQTADLSQPAAPAGDAPGGPTRDAHGRFAARDDAPAPDAAQAAPAAPAPAAEVPAPAAAPAAPAAPPAPPEGFVPIGVVQELRKEIRSLKNPPQAPQPVPDFNSDPDGAWAHQQQQFEQRLLNERLNSSERWARREHGAETVDKVKAWAIERFGADPHYYHQIMSQTDPYETAVQDWKRDQVLSTMKDGDLDAFLAWKTGQPPPGAAPAAQPAPTPPQSPTPPRSLASVPTAGAAKPGDTPVGPGVAFDKL